MDLPLLSAKYLANFLFILLRTSIFFTMVPFFSSSNFPAVFKRGLIVATALVLSPVVDFRIGESDIVMAVAKEVMFSMGLGLSVRFIFIALDVAGQIMSHGMGLSIASVFDPEMGQSTEVARFQGWIVICLALAMDAHHDLIYMLAKSYEFVPAGRPDIGSLAKEVITMGGRVFTVALKTAAPVTVGLLITNLLMGFISKAIPQMPIFFVSIPVLLVLGFVIIVLCLPVYVRIVGGYLGEIGNEMERMIRINSAGTAGL